MSNILFTFSPSNSQSSSSSSSLSSSNRLAKKPALSWFDWTSSVIWSSLLSKGSTVKKGSMGSRPFYLLRWLLWWKLLSNHCWLCHDPLQKSCNRKALWSIRHGEVSRWIISIQHRYLQLLFLHRVAWQY